MVGLFWEKQNMEDTSFLLTEFCFWKLRLLSSKPNVLVVKSLYPLSPPPSLTPCPSSPTSHPVPPPHLTPSPSHHTPTTLTHPHPHPHPHPHLHTHAHPHPHTHSSFSSHSHPIPLLLPPFQSRTPRVCFRFFLVVPPVVATNAAHGEHGGCAVTGAAWFVGGVEVMNVLATTSRSRPWRGGSWTQ